MLESQSLLTKRNREREGHTMGKLFIVGSTFIHSTTDLGRGTGTSQKGDFLWIFIGTTRLSPAFVSRLERLWYIYVFNFTNTLTQSPNKLYSLTAFVEFIYLQGTAVRVNVSANKCTLWTILFYISIVRFDILIQTGREEKCKYPLFWNWNIFQFNCVLMRNTKRRRDWSGCQTNFVIIIIKPPPPTHDSFTSVVDLQVPTNERANLPCK